MQQQQPQLINGGNNPVNRLRHQSEQPIINDSFNDENYDVDKDSSRRVLPNNFRNSSISRSNALVNNNDLQGNVAMRTKEFAQRQQQSFGPNLTSSALKSGIFNNENEKLTKNGINKEEEQIKTRIRALESELDGSQKEAEQMRDVLENTRTHYSQLENKYDQARQLLKNYQERLVFKLICNNAIKNYKYFLKNTSVCF